MYNFVSRNLPAKSYFFSLADYLFTSLSHHTNIHIFHNSNSILFFSQVEVVVQTPTPTSSNHVPGLGPWFSSTMMLGVHPKNPELLVLGTALEENKRFLQVVVCVSTTVCRPVRIRQISPKKYEKATAVRGTAIIIIVHHHVQLHWKEQANGCRHLIWKPPSPGAPRVETADRPRTCWSDCCTYPLWIGNTSSSARKSYRMWQQREMSHHRDHGWMYKLV